MADEPKASDLRTADVLGGAGACPEISWNNKTWKVGHPTLRALNRLEKLAVAKAVENVDALRDTLPPAMFARREAALDAAIMAGDFKTWGPGWRKVTGGAGGQLLLLLALIQEHHPEAIPADVEGLCKNRPLQIRAAILQVYPDFLSLALDHLGADPGQKPAVVAAAMADLRKNLGETETPMSPASASNS